MQTTAPRRSQAATAERDFLESLPGTTTTARPARPRGQLAQPLRIPVGEASEMAFDAMTRDERDSFFGAFDSTMPAAL
jgi:hypothetical protein